jgi:YHS domain-containing protein
MLEIKSFSSRIDDEFAAAQKKVKSVQADLLQEYRARLERLAQLEGVFQKLAEAWKPRLETLLQKFGDRVQVTPQLTPSTREATFAFASELGRVRLRFSASTDPDVQKVILGYDLEIIPIFFRYEPHAELVFSLDAVDQAAAAQWVDDRIVDFVRAYLSMSENNFYQQEHMVEDPVAHVKFPRFVAGATLERQGKKYYFIGEETRQEFEKNLAAKSEQTPNTSVLTPSSK